MHSEEEVTMHIIHTLETGKKQQSTYLIAILIFSFFKLNSRLLFLLSLYLCLRHFHHEIYLSVS